MNRRYHAAPHVSRDYMFRKRYGVTLEWYEAQFQKQGGVCAICRRPEQIARKKHLAVDHHHGTGKARGLLCDFCNRAIGLLGDDPVRVRSAARYLERTAGNSD